MNGRAWWARALVVVAASCAALVVTPVPRVFAASEPAAEQVDSFTIAYRVDRDGTVQVTETIAYRFGASSGRHGIFRDLLVREPYGDRQDQRYLVSDVTVTSPTGADTMVKRENVLLGSNRRKALRLRIGALDKTITGDTATYVIRYRLRGAIRSFDDHSELYWNATGRNWIAPLHKVTVTVDVPGGVTEATCYAGELDARDQCERVNVAGGRATYTHGTVPTGEQLTVVASIKPGEIREGTAILEPAAGPTSQGLLKAVGVLLATILAAVVAVLVFFRFNRGTEGAAPVADPPPISVAESRLFTHAIVDAEATQATLLELALLGAIRLDTDEQTTTTLLDAERATRAHHRALLRGLFPLLEPGTTIVLEHRGKGNRRLLDAQTAMAGSLRAEVATKEWFAELPSSSRRPPVLGPKHRFVPIFLSVLGLALLAFVAGAIGTAISERPLDGILVLALIVVAALALYVVRRTASRGRLTGTGRELVKELRSLQRYLSTVHRDELTQQQLVELLPWAMVLDRGDRWEELIAGEDPVSLFSAIGIFRLGRFRRGVAALMAGQLAGGTVSVPVAVGTGNHRESESDASSSGFSGGAGAGLGGGGGGGGGDSW